jgi:Tfp pilus assembly protein PilE
MAHTAYRRRQAGLTLIELLIVLFMTVVLAVSITFAFANELRTQQREEKSRATVDQADNFERQLTILLQGARLDATAASGSGSSTPSASRTTYFLGVSDGGSSLQGSDRVTFATTAPGIPSAALNDQSDFSTQQTTRGPVGGLTEISIGMNPVGSAGDKTGLFERIQTPSDGDWTQGGNESLLDSDISSIGFQFWDGEEWQDSWDTTVNTVALPQAVQVTYTLASDPSKTQYQFTVVIPSSTTSYQNIYSTTATTSGTAAP